MQILPAGLYFYLSCKGSINILIYTKKRRIFSDSSQKILMSCRQHSFVPINRQSSQPTLISRRCRE